MENEVIPTHKEGHEVRELNWINNLQHIGSEEGDREDVCVTDENQKDVVKLLFHEMRILQERR